MAAPVYVDLRVENCAPPDMKCTAPFKWGVLAQRAALLWSTVKLLAPPASSPAPAITRQLSHCIGLTQWLIPQQITKHIFVHKCSKLVKLAATSQMANLRAFIEASYASPSSQRESNLLSSIARVAHVLHNSAIRKCVGKLATTMAFPLIATKNCAVEESFGGVRPIRA